MQTFNKRLSTSLQCLNSLFRILQAYIHKTLDLRVLLKEQLHQAEQTYLPIPLAHLSLDLLCPGYQTVLQSQLLQSYIICQIFQLLCLHNHGQFSKSYRARSHLPSINGVHRNSRRQSLFGDRFNGWDDCQLHQHLTSALRRMERCWDSCGKTGSRQTTK